MDDRAATEALGTILLLALVVLLVTMVGLGLLAQTSAIEGGSERSYVNIQPSVNESTVSLTHVGGDSFPADELLVVVEGDNETVGPLPLTDAALEANVSDLFDIGDTVIIGHNSTGFVDISLYSPETDERLYRAVRSTTPQTPIPTPTTGGPTAIAQAPNQMAEGYSITLNGSGSYPDEPSGSIQSYSWSIVSGSGNIVEDDTATPNATYEAPNDVSGDQNVTIALSVTGERGRADTDTAKVRVVDIDNATAPISGDEKCAFDDENGNGVYDEGEPLTCKSDLEDGYTDLDGDLVIYPDVEEIKASGGELNFTANTITAGNELRATGGAIKLTADGDINIDGASLESNGGGGINITSRNGTISAVGTSLTTSQSASTELNSNGDIDLRSADLSSSSYAADLGVSTATLSVQDMVLKESSDTLVYDPDGIAVNGIPSRGTVSPT